METLEEVVIQRDALAQVSDVTIKQLAEQQKINASLRQALADTTGHVLTLCKVLGRLL